MSKTKIWPIRLLIGVVFAWNVQCALAFLIAPERFAPGFELSGVTGAAALRGIGLLFFMWNVPYAVALWRPIRHRVSLHEALAMQTIALLGESLIRNGLPAEHVMARESLARFIRFDAAGLLLLLLAAFLVCRYSVDVSSASIRQ